ncbi:uncharacterized protein [Clytia hemisphaerica]|uniref:uncharacterized protein n=1 Tax=Clytia hemisphaerica TaxID=252671 RepID=UPI0034D59EE6
MINNEDDDQSNDIDFVNEEDSEHVDKNDNDEENDNPLDRFRIPASETVFVPELAHHIIDDSNVTIAPGEDKEPLPIICDEQCEILAHPYLFPTGKFGYTYKRDIKLTPCRYFNQRLLNYTQKFSSDSDYIFYAQSVMQHLNLNSSINTALKKIQTEGLTAGRLSQNFKETISNLIANDDAFRFMNNLKGTPAYWKRFLYETLAMVKQLGLPTWFMSFSCADLRWPEIIEIIQKIKGNEMTEEEIKNLTYKERTEILQSNPVLMARHFQYRVECFFKTILAKDTLGGTLKHYSIRVEFQARGSPHIHCLAWIEGAPTLTHENIDEYRDFVDRVVKCDLPEDKESELYKLVTTYQVHRHSKSCRKYKNQPCRYHFGRFFTERTIIAKPIDPSVSNRDEILKERKTILSPVKKYIDDHFDPRYNNTLDPLKDNYEEPKSIDEILNELEIPKDVYYKNLAISTDTGFQIHYKRSPAACFINNYFEEGLLAWRGNLDIQPVMDYHKVVSYMCAYISKSEDQTTEAMKQAAKEAMNSNQTLREKMKSVSRAYRTSREMSIQEAVAIILPEIWLRKTSPGVIFANSNLPENRYRVCKSEEEILNMDVGDTNVFKKNMLDRYIDRPNRAFKNGRYAAMDALCYAQFLSNYYLEPKKKEIENDYQPEILDELDPAEAVDLALPNSVPLMSSKERLKLRKNKSVLRYHVPTLSYGSRDASKERLLTMAPTGVAAVNVAGSTINSVFSLPPGYEFSKHINKLHDSVRSSLQKRLSELQVIIIDEISMVSKYRLLHIHQRLCNIFECTENVPFAGISIITCGDFYQLPPIKGGTIFSLFPDALLNIDHCWRHFKIAELTEVMRQRGDQVFIDILNNIRIGVVDENNIDILKERIVNKDHPEYPKDAVHLWAENQPVHDHNMLKLSELPGEEVKVDSIDKFPDKISPEDKANALKRSQMQTGGLAHKFTFKLGAKVMITSNIDVEDKLCNGQMGTIEYIKLNLERKVTHIYLRMDEDDIGTKAKNNNDTYGRENNLVPIEKIEKEFGVKPGRHRPSIKRIQFPLMLAWACTVHKVQGQTFSKIVFNFDLYGQRYFNAGQVYVALSRVTSLQGLYLMGKFNTKAIRCDTEATEEYNYMRENLSLKTTTDEELLNENELKISLLNVRSLKKHAIDIKHDKSIYSESGLIFMTETQLANNSEEVENILTPLSLHTNNSDEHIYSNTTAAYNENQIQLLDAHIIPGATLYSFKHSMTMMQFK